MSSNLIEWIEKEERKYEDALYEEIKSSIGGIPPWYLKGKIEWEVERKILFLLKEIDSPLSFYLQFKSKIESPEQKGFESFFSYVKATQTFTTKKTEIKKLMKTGHDKIDTLISGFKNSTYLHKLPLLLTNEFKEFIPDFKGINTILDILLRYKQIFEEKSRELLSLLEKVDQTEKLLKINYQEVITMLGETAARELKKCEDKLVKTFYKAEKVEDVLKVAKKLYTKKFKSIFENLDQKAERSFEKIKGYKHTLSYCVSELYRQLKIYKKELDYLNATLGEDGKAFLLDGLPDPSQILTSLEKLGFKMEVEEEDFESKSLADKIHSIGFRLKKIVETIRNYRVKANVIKENMKGLKNPYVSLAEGIANLIETCTSQILFMTYYDFYEKELPEKAKFYEERAREFEDLRKEVCDLLRIDIKIQDFEERKIFEETKNRVVNLMRELVK